MGLIQWWVGALVVAGAALMAAGAWWWARPRKRTQQAVLAANVDRVRALPGFRSLVNGEWRRRRLEVVCLVGAFVGVALMGARFVAVGDDSREMRTRDVVLCLDVSGSMAEVDGDIIDTYVALTRSLDEERIGFVVFDAYAVTWFPLTTDHEYIVEQLRRAKSAIAQESVAGVMAAGVGSSLIGDGLVTCTQHFDDLEEPRSRTVVLGTDNLVAGDAIYTVPQAADMARDDEIMVFGVMPDGTDPKAERELREAAQTTRGDVLTISAGEPTNVARISSAITSQQKAAVLATAQDRSFDVGWPGALLFLLGVGGSLATVWRRA